LSSSITTITHATSTAGAATQVIYLLPIWVYYLFYGLIGGFVILIVVLGIFMWGMGEFRQFWFYRGDIVLESNGDGSRGPLYKADREASIFLRLRSRKLENPLRLARKGTALSRSGKATFYVTHAREQIAIDPKNVIYGNVLANKRAGLLNMKNAPRTIPKSAMDAVLEWKKERLEQAMSRATMPEPMTYAEYTTERMNALEEVEKKKRDPKDVPRDFTESEYAERIKMLREENERATRPIEEAIRLVDEIRTNQILRKKPDGTPADPLPKSLKDKIVRSILAEIASQPDSVWPAEVFGEAVDLRDLASSNLFGVNSADVDQAQQIAEKRAERRRKGNDRTLILLFAVIALILVGGIVLDILMTGGAKP
jgi:hypothetical protein